MVHGNLRPRGHESIKNILFVDMHEKGAQINFSFEQNNSMSIEKVGIIAWNIGQVVTSTIASHIRVYDIKSQALIHEINDNEKEHNLSCFTLYSENTMITGCSNGKIKIWNFHTGAQIDSFVAHEGSVECISISTNWKPIISDGRSNGIKIWLFETKALVAIITGLGQKNYAIFTLQDDYFFNSDSGKRSKLMTPHWHGGLLHISKRHL